ncbi:MAG TPA: BatA domain-containing protein, partial [Planctomycetaceae bacterium]
MDFLGLTFLWALPLAAVPVLLHLFDRRRRVVIEWGAMQFLVQAARRRTSARRLREWLLLLLRTLAVLCLVLALARPLVHSRWSGAGERREHILVIDNSLSMMRAADGKSLYEAAIQAAG